MAKILFISGSPRDGNTDFVLKSLYNMIHVNKEIVFLRDMNINHCTGCLSCDGTGTCPVDDDMQGFYKKMESADIFILGSPNYFDNVSGLMKDMIDRSNTFYNNNKLKGKKVVFIVVGGGTTGDSKRVTDQAFTYFANGVGLNIHAKYAFSGTDKNEIRKDPNVNVMLKEVFDKISELL